MPDYSSLGIIVNPDGTYELTDAFFKHLDTYIYENFAFEKADVNARLAKEAALEKSFSKMSYQFMIPQTQQAQNDKKEMEKAGLDVDALDKTMLKKPITWAGKLFELIDEKGFTDVEFYTKANVDKRYFSKVRSNENYHPEKKKAILFGLTLQLSMDEMEEFLGLAGYYLAPSKREDLIVECCISEGIYDLGIINMALKRYGCEEF